MRNSLKILVIFLLILTVDGKADAARTNGRAEMLKEVDGKGIVLLNDDVYLDCECELSKGENYLIGIRVRLPPEFQDVFFIKKDEKLYDLSGQEIGRALSELHIERHFVTRDGKRFGEIEGFIGKNKIKRESILKNALIDVLNAKNRRINFSDLREHLNEFKYRELIGHHEYKTYIY